MPSPSRWKSREQQHSFMTDQGEIRYIFLGGYIGDNGSDNKDIVIHSDEDLIVETTNKRMILDGVSIYQSAVAPTGTTTLAIDGYVTATRVYSAVYNDIAECFTPSKNLNMSYEELKHRVVSLTDDGEVELCQGSSHRTLGIVSDEFAYLLGGTVEEVNEGKKIPIGLTGTLNVYMSDDEINLMNRLGPDQFISNRMGLSVVGSANGTVGWFYGEEKHRIGKIVKVFPDKKMFRVLITTPM